MTRWDGTPACHFAQLRKPERAQIAAAMARRHAALNIIVRDKLEEVHRRYMLPGRHDAPAGLAGGAGGLPVTKG